MEKEAIDNLLGKPEGPSLDWKQDFPDELRAPKGNGVRDKGKSKLMKSLVSIANAAEEGRGHLVYGVKDLGDTRDVTGISKHFDDADFQEWAKFAFVPPPIFLYSEIACSDERTVGVFEIERVPEFPHVCRVSLGETLHQGQVWHRRGSQNEIALRDTLKVMFEGEKPFTIRSCAHDKAKELVDYFRSQGNEPVWPSIHDRDVKLDDGYRLAYCPGTRREVWAGLGRNNEWEHVLMLKPR